MAEVPAGSSVDNVSVLGGLFQRVQHPTKILRRTQSHNKGLGSGLGSHSNPVSDSQLHATPESDSHSDHFGIAGELKKRWASYKEGMSFGSDHHHLHRHNRHFLFHNHMNQQLHSPPHHHHHHHGHQHQHQHQHRFRFGPWRRWGSVRDRPQHHKECVMTSRHALIYLVWSLGVGVPMLAAWTESRYLRKLKAELHAQNRMQAL